jgi:ABC-type uncharacterized transport system ATPase subunit
MPSTRWLDPHGQALQAQAAGIIRASMSRPVGRMRRPSRLSGGNLQKFIVGREIDANPKLLIVSQPTWGVDVGAAAQIRGEILACAMRVAPCWWSARSWTNCLKSATACM